MFEEKCQKEDEIFSGSILKLNKDIVKLKDGSLSKREIVKANDASCCVALDNEDNIILVKQYRYAHKKESLELPGGKIEAGEDPKAAVKRELLEETGYVSNNWEELGQFYPATYSTQMLHIFLARNVVWKQNLNLDEGEFLNVLKVSFDDFLKDVLDGKIRESQTIIGVLKYNQMFRVC